MEAVKRIDAAIEELWDVAGASHEYDDETWRACVRQACERVELAFQTAAANPEVPRPDSLASAVAETLARLGDELFYGRGESNAALLVFDTALRIDPESLEALKGAIACHLQGSHIDPAAALPYAERLVALDPSRKADLEYIRGRVRS